MDDESFKDYNLLYPFPDEKFFSTFVVNKHKPSFSAFSQDMKIFKLKSSYPTWDKCLAELGKIYRESRGNLERRHSYEKRQYIGAPITVRKKKESHNEAFLERHSKPYFLRIIKIAENCFDGYMLYLPSKYCEGVGKRKG